MKLRKITQEEFDKIYAEHQLWLNSNGKEGKYANFSYCDLTKISFPVKTDLTYANLTYANLSGIYLSEGNFSRANLSGAILLYTAFFM